MLIDTELADKYQDFFNFMNQEHDLILTGSEMNEILSEANKLQEKLNQSEQLKDFAEKVNKYYNGGCGTADELIDKMNKIF